MAGSFRNVVVVGGSYVGMVTTKELVNVLPATHRILLVEPHSHFHHLFAFPRFAVLPAHEHKAFIPYTATFAADSRHAVVQARVAALHPDRVILDREWQGSKEIPFEYLVVATGTRLQAPSNMEGDDKASSVKYFQSYQERVDRAKSILIIGGGAVGVQMAADIKELYPEKEVTLVHSRNQLMPVYHEALDTIIKKRFEELGVKLVLGSRVRIPSKGFPEGTTAAELVNGTTLSAELIIPATGQTPNTQFLSSLPASSPDSLVNPTNRFIRVKPTLQFQDPTYPNLFALGDVADSGAHKAARPGAAQAKVVANNILSMVEGREPAEKIDVQPAGIHLSLGITKNLLFRNPDKAKGETEPFIVHRDDGKADMGIDAVWERRGIKVKSPEEYHL